MPAKGSRLEIFVIEGEQAARNLMMCRDHNFQSIVRCQAPGELVICGRRAQPHVAAIISNCLYEGQGADVLLVPGAGDVYLWKQLTQWLESTATPTDIRGHIVDTGVGERTSILDLPVDELWPRILDPETRRATPIRKWR